MSDRSIDGIDQLDKYRTAPLRFPLHVLNEDGEPLCGSMADDQERFVQRHGLDGQPTLREKKGNTEMIHFLTGLCGNCRRSLFSESGTEELQEVWKEHQRRVEEVKA